MEFSILIPTWNNLDYLKLCIASIRRNSAFNHQIIVHVNEGGDGTLEWVRQQGIDHTSCTNNEGVCWAMNRMRRLVKKDYIFYVNDDMYLLPGWDVALDDEIGRLPDNMFFLSGTMIQPHSHLDVGFCADYGDSVDTFQEERLLREYTRFVRPDWMGATWPPNLIHRDLWDLVGGYSVEYTPGMYSDPDLTAKLWMAGVRHMKGLAGCKVYHFETKSTGRVKKNNGSLQFLLKWGFPNSYFRKHFTHLGESFDDSLIARPDSLPDAKFRLKALWKLLVGQDFGIRR